MNRDPFRDGQVWAWLLTVSLLLVALLWLLSCASSEKAVDTVRAEACWELINGAIQSGRDCPNTVAAVTEVVRRDPDCAVVTRAITLVCHTDGGPHD